MSSFGTIFKKKRKNSSGRQSRTDSSTSTTDNSQTDVIISDQRIKEIAASANIPENVLITMDNAQKMSLLKAYEKSQTNSSNNIMKLCSELQYSIGDDTRFISVESVTTARQLLQNCLLGEIKTFIDNNGILYFLKIISMEMFSLEEAFNKKFDSLSKHLLYINECISCIHQVFSTDFGYKLLADPQSSIVPQFFIFLMILNEVYEMKSTSTSQPDVTDTNNIDQARYNILRILAPLPVYVDKATKQTSLPHVLRCLDFAAMVKCRSRFSCAIDCLTSENPKVVNMALNFINTIINSAGNEKHEFQARIIMRNEILRAGMSQHFDRLRKLAEKHKGIENAFLSFEKLQTNDFNELENVFKEKPDFSTFKGCIQSFGDFEDDLIGILQVLALVSEGAHNRKLYFVYAEHVLRQCLFGISEQAEIPSSLLYGIGADDALTDAQDGFSKHLMAKLVSTNMLKEQAMTTRDQCEEKLEHSMTKCYQYQQKMAEFLDETVKLRAHIANSKENALPSKTSCDLPTVTIKPMSSTSSCLPPVTGGPPPPPPPNGLPRVTGGPPPPPPPSSGLSKSGRGPPPPPNHPLVGSLLNFGSFVLPLPPYLKEKMDVISDKPMKKLCYWKDYVIPPIHISEKSLWALIDDRDVCKAEVIAKIQDNFFDEKQAKAESSKPKKKKTKTFVIEDPQKLLYVALNFTPFKLTCSQWVDVVYNVDLQILSSCRIDIVLKILSKFDDKMQKLAECSDEDFDEMDIAEKFLVVSAKIPALKARLKAMHLCQTWNENITIIKKDLSSLDLGIAAFKSESFKVFLNLVLFVGNYMNRTSSSVAPAYAFKLTLLKTLNNVKGNEPEYSLLHALTELMNNNIFHDNVLSTELDIIAMAAKVDFTMIEEQVNSLQIETNATTKFIETFKAANANDKFAEKMTDFINIASTDIADISMQLKNVDKRWEALQDYLATKKLLSYKMKDLFDDVVQFRAGYNRICIELQKKKELDEKKKEAPTTKMPLKSIPTPNLQLPMNSKKTADGRGFLDSLLEDIDRSYCQSDEISQKPDTSFGSRRITRSKVYNVKNYNRLSK